MLFTGGIKPPFALLGMQQTRGNPYQQRQRQLGSRASAHMNRGASIRVHRDQQTSQHSGSKPGGNMVNASALSPTDRQLLEQAVIEAVLREGIISGVRKAISGTGALLGLGAGTGAGSLVGGGALSVATGIGGGIAGEAVGRGAAKLLGGKSSASYEADAAKKAAKNTSKAPSKPVVS